MKRFLCCLLFLAAPFYLFAQDSAYNVSMELKITDGTNQQTVSDSHVNHVTTAGKPVTLNINGGNFKAAVIITLYNQGEDSLVLLTQSRVVSTDGEKKVLATAKSIPVELGEKILYFPRGILSKPNKDGYSCILELQVTRQMQ